MPVLKGIAVTTAEEAKKAALKFRDKLVKGEISKEDLMIVEQLGKKLEMFERKTKASVAATWLLKEQGIEIHRGENLNIIIIKGEGGINERARPAEFFDLKDCDLNYYIGLFDQVINRDFSKLGG